MVKQHKNLTRSQDVCEHIVLQLAGERFRNFVILYKNWSAVVGDLLSSKSHPIKCEQGFLYVAVANNVWLQELVLLKKKIIVELTKKTGIKINDVFFTIRTGK